MNGKSIYPMLILDGISGFPWPVCALRRETPTPLSSGHTSAQMTSTKAEETISQRPYYAEK